MNNRISNESLLSRNQIESLKQSARNASLFYEEKIRDYFQVFTTDLKAFKERFPNLVNELYEVHDKYEKDNPHIISRSDYIKKHIELSFQDFQQIIFRKPQQLVIDAFQQIYDNVYEETLEKIKRRLLLYEGILPGISVIGWIGGGIGFVVSVSDLIGFWKKKNTREDITRGLLDWLVKNKGKIINDTLKNYQRFSQIFIEEPCNYKVMEDQSKDLFSECNKFKGDIKPFPEIDHKQELLNILPNRRLQNFFTRVFDYREEEEDE